MTVISRQWAGLALYFLAVLIAIALYAPSFNGPLVLDDYTSLGPLLGSPRLPPDWPYYVMSPTGPFGRPLSMLSFLANLAWTGPNIAAWKATNLALHCAVGLLLFDIGRRLLELHVKRREHAALAASFLAALWLLHPVHPGTVLYTVQRMTILSTLFTVAGIDLYLWGRLSERHNRVACGALWAAYLVCLPLAALAKEIGLLMPGYLWALELTLLRGLGSQAMRQQAQSLSLVFCIVPLVGGAIYCAIDFERLIIAPNLLRGWTTTERLLTEARVVVRYLGEAIIPNRLMFGFFHDDIEVSHGMFTPPTTVLSIMLLMVLLTVGWLSRKRAPLFACGVFWFFVANVLESTIVSLEIMFEHRNYFASFGILLAVLGAIVALSGKPNLRMVYIGGLLALALLSVVTKSITRDWHDEASLYASSFQLHPQSPNATSTVAELLTGHQQYDSALTVLANIPATGARLQEKYIKCLRDGRLNDRELSTSLVAAEPALSMYAVTGLIEIAKLGLDKRCVFQSEAMIKLLAAALTRPIAHKRNRFLLHFYSAHYQWSLGRSTLAFANLDAAKQADSEDPMPYFLASEWLNKLGRRVEGLSALADGRGVASRSGKDYSSIMNAVAALYNALPKG